MNNKKKSKRLAHAEMVWEREQLKAAMIAEQLDKAIAAVEQYREELTQEQIDGVYAQVNLRKKDLEEYVISAKNKYLAKLKELQSNPVIIETDESEPDNLEEL
jgi:hypothetical protein